VRACFGWLSTVCANDDLWTIPVVVLSTTAQPKDQTRALLLGARLYVIKHIAANATNHVFREAGKGHLGSERRNIECRLWVAPMQLRAAQSVAWVYWVNVEPSAAFP